MFEEMINPWLAAYQRKQLIDRQLCDLPHAIGVVHAGDVDALHTAFDLVAGSR